MFGKLKEQSGTFSDRPVKKLPEKVIQTVVASTGTIKSEAEDKITEEFQLKLNMCVFGMLVTYFIGFFITFDYSNPVHPVLHIPVLSILAFTLSHYVMRYVLSDVTHRVAVTLVGGLWLGMLSRYLSVTIGTYKLITIEQPLLLFPLMGVLILSFVMYFKYIFEISKPKNKRWLTISNLKNTFKLD